MMVMVGNVVIVLFAFSRPLSRRPACFGIIFMFDIILDFFLLRFNRYLLRLVDTLSLFDSFTLLFNFGYVLVRVVNLPFNNLRLLP